MILDKYFTKEEINKIISSNNIGAIRVKYSDMLDNSDPKRLSKLDEATRIKLNNKYSPQIKKLWASVNSINKKERWKWEILKKKKV